ncbi:MAG: hypothetical protein Q8P67_27580, partial [archaeon]|nr:hypothetical protein [archaeon]
DDDDDDSGDGIDRSATTGDPDFMAADMDFDDMGAMGGPKVETLDLRSIKLKGKPEIDKIVAAISEILSPYRNNLPFFNVPVAMVVALADAEGINATVSELNRMSREKAARIKVMKGRKAPKRADVKAAPKTASSSSAKPRGPQKPIDFWTYTPVYLEDYEKWGGLIADGLRLFSRSSNYNQLILALTRDWCSHLEPDEIRRVVQPLNRRANDMLEATKPKKKVSTKASLVGASGKRGDDGMKTYDEAFTADY